MKASFTDKEGKDQIFMMGCYGIGVTRSLATVVEVNYDVNKNKMIWPKEIAPFSVHLISLDENEKAEEIYNSLTEKGIDVLYDDRDNSAGEKFAEADLIGCPTRIIISKKSLGLGGVEVVENDGEPKIVKIDELNL